MKEPLHARLFDAPAGVGGGVQPLVILHGLFGSGDNWRYQATRLAARSPVITLDLPNHGDSPHIDEGDFRVIAEIVAEDLAKRGIERASLLGHSMGGKVAMAIALSNPSMVANLIVVDIAARPYAPRHDDIFAGLSAVRDEAPESRGAADRILSQFIQERAVRAFLLKSYGPGQDGRFRWKMNVPTLHRRYDEMSGWPFSTEEYEGPTLLIRADQSPYVSDDDIASTRRHFPSLETVTMTGVGHWLHAEKPDEFCEVAFQFLS